MPLPAGNCGADGIQVEVAVEDDRAARERAGESAGEAAHKHVLTCNAKTQHMYRSPVGSRRRPPG
ncbi:hypothetical protein EYF80_003717 [Liparis tanakae]|uniref:Uncharacterized protein n=1 Tax=Liparis tanakae TaxID=230148 RepID=A0A4Z2J899_9TELE|nr:hypothetical protein EYF80_003717 [Liparis tanakae]